MFIIFLPNFSGRFAENAIFVSTETFWGEVFLWKTSLLPLLSHIDREFFGQLSIFLTVSLKLHSTCIEKWFEQEIMKNWYFFIFSDFERSFSRFFLKICQWCCQNWFLHPQRNVLWKNVFVEKNYNFLSLSHIERKKLDFVETVLAWMSNLHSTCPLEYFEEKGLCWKLFFQIMTFGQWANFFSDFCRKVLGRGIQNCNLHVDRKFLRKISFSSVEKPFFSFPCGKKNLTRSFHLGTYCFRIFLIMAENFSANCLKSSDGAVKTALCISGGKIWRKRDCSKILFF